MSTSWLNNYAKTMVKQLSKPSVFVFEPIKMNWFKTILNKLIGYPKKSIR